MANKRKAGHGGESVTNKAPNWLVLAEAIRDGLNGETWKRAGKYRSVAAWLKDVSDREGYAPASLRRMGRIFDYLESRLDTSQLRRLKSSGDAPLAALEILVRLSELPGDPSKQYLAAVLSGSVTFRQLRNIYGERAKKRGPLNVRSEGIRRLKELEQEIYNLIGPDVIHLSGREFMRIPEPHVFFRRERRFPYSLPDFVSYRLTPKGEMTFDGFEIRLTGLEGKVFQLNYVLALACFHARFFRHYWLILADLKSSSLVDNICGYLQELKLMTVGLIHVPVGPNGELSGKYHILRKPLKSGSDDLQDLLKEYALKPMSIFKNPDDPHIGRFG